MSVVNFYSAFIVRETLARLSLSDQAIQGCAPEALIGPWGNLLLPYLDYFNNNFEGSMQFFYDSTSL